MYHFLTFFKGHCSSSDLIMGEEDIISPSTLICAAIERKLHVQIFLFPLT